MYIHVCISVFPWPNGVRGYYCYIQGDVVAGEYHGEGTYTWPDGSSFTGPFTHNK